jgi:hypothetical protein
MATWRFQGHFQIDGTVHQITSDELGNALPINTTLTVTDMIFSIDSQPETLGCYISLADDVNGRRFEEFVRPESPLSMAGLTTGPQLSLGANHRFQLTLTGEGYAAGQVPEGYYDISGTTP